MKRILLFILPLAFLYLSCKREKTLHFDSFSIDVPKDWEVVDTLTKRESQPDVIFTSFKGRINAGLNDTLIFEISPFARITPEYLAEIVGNDTSYYPVNNMLDSTAERRNFNVKSNVLPYVVKSIYTDTVVDGLKSKIFKTVRPGIGITGINFDSVWQDKVFTKRFVIYGKNLDAFNEPLLLKAVKTIRFYNLKSTDYRK